MQMCTCGHQTMVTETSKMINFWGHFVYNMVIAILFIGIKFFHWQVFLRWVKTINETTTLLTHFAHNTTILINKLGKGHNFSLMASAFLVKDFMQMKMFVWICTNYERVCLDVH